MFPAARSRVGSSLTRRLLLNSSQIRTAVTTGTTSDNPIPANNPNPREPPPSTSGTPVPTSSGGSGDRTLQEMPEEAEKKRVMQAPNRAGIWSRSQQPRERAMSGPRFEQTMMEDQPRPYAAIDLIHRQPVRWTKKRVVECDGGGGPLGHPRIFINVDKPQINMCTYCGLPFANEHHRKALEAQETTAYPLGPTGDEMEVNEAQRVSDEPFGHR